MHTFCIRVWLVTKEIRYQANCSSKQFYLLSISMKLAPGHWAY